MALGWRVTHSEQENPYEQEVTVEQSVTTKGRGKRADYAFTVAPHFRDLRFFVEARKPGSNIDNADDYFQTVRYGWNARTPFAVLTDFAQFRVLDCRYEPDIDSVLSSSALEKFHYSDYTDPEKFRRIYHLFSRADVARGSLERYAESLPKPGARGQRAVFVTNRLRSVDESFLQKLDTCRKQLAQTFERNNPRLKSSELTEATQRTLDRLVLMRFLEDRLIETKEIVQRVVDSVSPWREFVAASRELNATYNGIIFQDHALLDGADLEIDERAFADICKGLSYARAPYHFNYIPIQLLGSIYERFLGKTIITEGAEARVEDKAEARKAGGVYYTPEYIVRYIVGNTIGQLIREQTPEEISQMRFADISCGSGSFLIGVYDLLLRYHRNYYNANKKRKAEGHRAGCVELPDGSLQLSLKQKRAILTNNIYGVDIDAQAVEVAQLSLYLKLLEDETTASTRLYQLESGDQLLPSLKKNLISGNALIDWDLLSGKLCDRHEERKLNPVSFKGEFPRIMLGGGFDAIVGNPPYIFARAKGFTELEKSYFKKFKSYSYQLNTFVLFTEQAFNLLKKEGYLGYIIPNNWLSIGTMKTFRDFILSSTGNLHIVNHRYKVFPGANIDTSLLVFQKTAPGCVHLIESTGPDEMNQVSLVQAEEILTKPVIQIRLHQDQASRKLVERIQKNANELAALALVKAGLKAYETGKGIPPQTDAMKHGRIYHSTKRINPSYRIYLDGKDVKRYSRGWSGEYLKYGPNLAAPRDPSLFEGVRLLVRQIPSKPPYSINAVIVSGEELNDINSMIIKVAKPYSANYVLGIINSKLITFWFERQFDKFQRGIFPQFKVNELATFPIRKIEFANASDKARHDKMGRLVERMLDAKKLFVEATTDGDKHLYERKCASLDRQIDEFVYKLYGLTKEEIELVEASRFRQVRNGQRTRRAPGLVILDRAFRSEL